MDLVWPRPVTVWLLVVVSGLLYNNRWIIAGLVILFEAISELGVENWLITLAAPSANRFSGQPR